MDATAFKGEGEAMAVGRTGCASHGTDGPTPNRTRRICPYATHA